MASLEEVKKFLKKSVDWLKDEDMGCTTLKLDDKLAICVGWLPGYGEEARDDVIQSTSEPDFAINAGVKVWTSDDMRTDYEFINMPYYENGEVIESDVSIDPSDEEDGYEKVAQWLLDQYESIKDLDMDDKGLILEKKPEEVETKTEVEVEEELSKSDCIKKELIARGLDKADDIDGKEVIDIANKCGCEQAEVVDVWKHDKSLKEEKEDDKLNSYKEEFVKSLDEFSKAYEKLAGLMQTAGFDCNEFINTKKAKELMNNSFAKKSLDELTISEWCEEIKSNINKWKPGEWLDESLKEEKELELPKEVTMDMTTMNDLGINPSETGGDELDEIIGDWLSDEYGYCHFGFEYDVENDHINIYNIEWDTSESLKSCDKKKIKESWDGENVIDDLVERAQDKVNEGMDADDAVMEAIDEGLIYTSDIIALLEHYGSIDDSTIIESYYDDLYSDILSNVEISEEKDELDWEDEEESEEGEEVEESINETKSSLFDTIQKQEYVTLRQWAECPAGTWTNDEGLAALKLTNDLYLDSESWNCYTIEEIENAKDSVLSCKENNGYLSDEDLDEEWLPLNSGVFTFGDGKIAQKDIVDFILGDEDALTYDSEEFEDNFECNKNHFKKLLKQLMSLVGNK